METLTLDSFDAKVFVPLKHMTKIGWKNISNEVKIELTLNTLEFKDSKSVLAKKFWFDSIILKNLK
jgi:hypothetical protein